MYAKETKLSKVAKHHYLRYHYGRPTFCSNEKCEGKSKIFEWCKKIGRRYTRNPNDYLWLCRSCHRRYDLTPTKRRLAIKNLTWSKGKSTTKLRPKQVKEIVELLAKGMGNAALGRQFKVDGTTIRDIKSKQIWRQVI